MHVCSLSAALLLTSIHHQDSGVIRNASNVAGNDEVAFFVCVAGVRGVGTRWCYVSRCLAHVQFRIWIAAISAALVVGCSGDTSQLLQSGAISEPTLKPQKLAALETQGRFDVPPTAEGLVRSHAEVDVSTQPLAVGEPKRINRKGSQIAYGTDRFVDQSRGINHAEALPDGDIVLNFSDTDIRELAQAVLGDVLGLNFVVDLESQGRITLRTNRPIPKSAVLPTLETTLNAGGLALSKEGDIYRIVPTSKVKGTGKTTRMLRESAGLRTGYSVVAVPLKYVAPSQMAKLIEPMAPPNSILNADDSRNLMVVAAIGPEMEALLDTIEMFDVDGMRGMSFGYFKIHRSNVADVTKELKSIVAAHAASASIAQPRLVPLERLNSLLVISSRQQTLKLVEDWIDKLDQSSKTDELKLFVYHVKNRKAKELAALLENVFSQNDTTVGAAGRAPTSGAQDDIPISANPSSLGQTSLPPDERLAIIGASGVRVANAGAGEGAGSTSTDASSATASARDIAKARIVADEEHNTLVIRARQVDYESIVKAIDGLDFIAPLVMIEVTIAEIKLQDGLQFGIEWFFKKKNSEITFSSIASGQIISKFPGFSYFFSAADIAASINALAEVTDVRIVSSPKLMVRDNKTASLQIGDQVPILTSTVQGVTNPDAPIVQTVQYFDTGVILKVTPQVNARGLVTMDVVQEVSNVATDQQEGIASPTIQQRKLASSLSVQSGEAVVLGGMMRESRSKATTGVPLLAEIPGVGDLFKTHDNAKERTELLVVITPRVVWGRSDAQLVTDELRAQLESVANTKDRGTRAFIGQRSENGLVSPGRDGYSAKD